MIIYASPLLEQDIILNVTKYSIELGAPTPPGYFGLLVPLNQQAKKGITVLGRMVDPYYLGEAAMLLQKGGEKDSVCSIGDSLGYPWCCHIL